MLGSNVAVGNHHNNKHKGDKMHQRSYTEVKGSVYDDCNHVCEFDFFYGHELVCITVNGNELKSGDTELIWTVDTEDDTGLYLELHPGNKECVKLFIPKASIKKVAFKYVSEDKASFIVDVDL
jgi:hypothetical protein